MEWLMGSLLHAGYFGESYLFWDWGDQDWSKIILIALLKKELIFLYRCGELFRGSIPFWTKYYLK